MAQRVTLPELGESVKEAEVLAVLVSEGERVEREQVLLEIETDKATVEFPSPLAGEVRALYVAQGDRVEVGAALLEIEPVEADSESSQSESESEAEAESTSVSASDSDSEPEPSEAAAGASGSDRAPGVRRAAPERDELEGEASGAQSRGDVPSDSPSREWRAPRRPQDEEPPGHAEADREAESGPEAAAGDEEGADRADEGGGPAPTARRAGAPAAPLVRQLARELGVDLAAVAGSGPRGAVRGEDVKAYVRGALARRAPAPVAAGGADRALPDFERHGPVQREPLSGIRRRTAERLSHAWRVVPHVTQFDRSDITELERQRRSLDARVREEGGARITLTAVAIAVAAAALRRFPEVNASLDLEREERILKGYVNIGVAVDTPHGLLVPVVRGADRMSLGEIAHESAALAQRARDRKLDPASMEGASFTVTNLGGLGTTYFTPLVSWPELAVLGVGRARRELGWPEDAPTDAPPEPRWVLPLSVSYDHRGLDGADAARFLRWIAEALERPLELAMER